MSKELNALKAKALNMLQSLSQCPEYEINGCEFHNGLQRPNNQPPQTVYLTYEGKKYRRSKDKKQWETVS